MNLQSFSVILHSLATLCSSVCPECYPCLSAVGFINNENVIFSLSFFLPHFLSSILFFPPCSCQPFMSPRYPGGPRPSLRMPNQVLSGILTLLTPFMLILTSQSICVATSQTSILISFHAWSFVSLLGESLDHSLYCQTVWIQQDRKVQLVQLEQLL